ncbi:carboxymuconolactone decarboxylase family protein [Streptomyces sp. TS71-3]|uniref:carboxymuconolactone decarboxylase family protein n=1 Tax=Streptomyces sp. TS71-3 TaxID=2733862 RepID=UPI001B1F5547|nr:peroxidase-related enzyme [Streptomyces sp. TS71-3]GHJ36919.1 alkyl hydroperoxide reductase AhpD [Streptomyces sp. TS71-3]
MPFLPSLPDNATVMDVLRAFPEPAGPLVDYQQVVLRGPSPLSVGERELIAAYVSGLNACRYCHGVHGAVAEAFGIEEGVLAALLADVASAPVDDRLKPLFAYVRKLTETPGRMAAADAEAVFAAGWEEKALYDAVSVCALFNFMNRIVEGFGITAPDSYFAVAARRLSSDDGFTAYRGPVPRDPE